MKHPIALAALLSSLALVHAADTFLIENGQPRAEIVIAEKPARMTKLAAKELQTYLEKISGAKLEVRTVPTAGLAHIFLGKSSHTEALKLATEGLENGAFRMASGADWLALVGPDEDFVPIEPWGRMRSTGEQARVNAEFDKITGDTFWNHFGYIYARYHKDLDVWDYDDAGTLNAVYEFLRGLGVRWFAPGELGEVVPKLATIALPGMNKTVKPDFGLRRFTFYTEHTGLGDKGIWMLRLGLNQAHKIGGISQVCHGMKFVIMRDEMKQAHPEMYLLTGGKRDTTTKGSGYPDLTSPLFFEKQLKYSRVMFDHFREPMISIDLVDGYGGMTSDDPKWMAQLTPERGWSGTMSDQVWGYINRVALEHLNLYVTARLWWDADQNLDALLTDYFTSYYGPAAKPMQAFAEFSEANWMHMGQDGAKIGEAFTLLAAAQAAADPQSLPGRRIQKIADLMKPLHTLQQQLSRKHDTTLDYRVLETHQTGGKPLREKAFDGQVLKDYWTDVRSAPLVKLTPDAPRPIANSMFQIQREGSILHIGIICQEPDMPGLNIATTTPDDPKLLAGDHITLLIETASNNYYEITINPAGTVLEIDHGKDGKGVAWTSGAQFAVHRGDKEWSIEMRLPITGEGSRMIDPLKGIDGAMPKDLFPWHFNLCRQRVRGTTIERTAFSATGKDDFYVPEKFTKLWGKGK